VPAPNPYAPPRVDAVPAIARGPLPEGIRRYALDRDKLRDVLDRAWRGLVVRMVGVLALYLALQVYLGILTLDVLEILIPVLGGYSIAASLFRRWRIRRNEAAMLQGYELLVSPRVLRRTAFRAVPAEILAPEVTSIVEVAQGLSLEARGVKQRLFVSRAIQGYEEVRDHVARWRPIETRGGFASYRRRWMHRFGEKVRRDVTDPSLAGELEAVRALAMPPGPRPRRWGVRMLILWAVLIVMFLAIWQFLSPERNPPPHRHRAPPALTE
jgi:hypothetical protein